MSASPDEVIDHRPTECADCGADLAGAGTDAGFAARQVVELPEVKPV